MKGKRIRIVFGLSLLCLSLGSCHFLEVDPVGKTTIPIFFRDMDGIRAGLVGSYSATYDYYSAEFGKYPDVAGNMLKMNVITTTGDMMSQYNFVSAPEEETGAVGYIWRKTLYALANINNVLHYLPAVADQYPQYAAEQANIKAQCLFLRALCHFDLVRVYAQPYNYTADASHLGVPLLLKTPGPGDVITRKSCKLVYDQILRDLNESVRLFGNTPEQDVYHVSRTASEAFLSRVYLYQEKWDSVIHYSTRVLQKKSLSYGDDYVGMYQRLLPGNESIFRLGGTLKSSGLAKFYSPVAPVAVPADTLVNLFDLDDIRLRLLSYESSRVCSKYVITSAVSDAEKHYDPMVFRASEMLLNRAEAYLNKDLLDLAAADMKRLIGRALDKQPEEVQLVYANKEALARIIEKERAKELCFESHNFFDITRRKQNLVRERNTNSQVKFIAYPSDYFVLPISQYELNANRDMQPNPTVNR